MTESLHAVSPRVAEADPPRPLKRTRPSSTQRVRLLLGAVIVMTGNRAEAEEVLQVAFLKVWERWDHVVAMECGHKTRSRGYPSVIETR